MNLWLAPLHGITYFYLRNLMGRHFGGINYAIAPFIPVLPGERINIYKWKDLLPENNTGMEIIPQLMGNEASFFYDTISALSGLGYDQFNWNIGCPAKPIVRKKRGCGIMPYPEEVENIVSTITRKTNCRFSVKMRLGLTNPGEGEEIIRRLNNYPLQFIIIHPRLGTDQYDGIPDMREFERLLRLSIHEIIYNGDINSKEDCDRLSENYPRVSQWMIGRGLLRNPFLAEEITGKVNHIQSRQERFIGFYEELLPVLMENRSPKGALGNLKELWHYYSCFWEVPSEILQSLLRINELDHFFDSTLKIMNRG